MSKTSKPFPPAVMHYVDGWRVCLVVRVGSKWATLFNYATFETYRIAKGELRYTRPVDVRPAKVRTIIQRRMRRIRRQRRAVQGEDYTPPQFPKATIARILEAAS